MSQISYRYSSLNITSRWANIDVQIYKKDRPALVPGAQQIVKSSDNTLKNTKNSPILSTLKNWSKLFPRLVFPKIRYHTE